MTTEYDLACADCDGPLTRLELTPDDVDHDVTTTLPVAECEDCGNRYYPSEALEAIGRDAS
jgi:uncharacterized protein with PIN domain